MKAFINHKKKGRFPIKQISKRVSAALLAVLMGLSLLPQTVLALDPDQRQAERREGYDVATVHYTDAKGDEQAIPFTETGSGYVYTLPQGVADEQVTVEYFSTTRWDGAVDISWYNDIDKEFTLTTPAQLAGLAALVAGQTSAETSRWRIKGGIVGVLNNSKSSVVDCYNVATVSGGHSTYANGGVGSVVGQFGDGSIANSYNYGNVTLGEGLVCNNLGGVIGKQAGKGRALTLTEAPQENQVPIVGNVAAGSPILAQECIEDYLTFDTGGRDGEYFALRVRGESMINAGILPDDLVVVHQQPAANNGEIVVALLGDEATVKRLKRQGREVWLLPENPAYQPIDGREARILGKVAAVIRRY